MTEILATEIQWRAWKRRLRNPIYYAEALLHAGLAFLATWGFPPLWAFILVREMKQAATGDGRGRPSFSTGWLDPLTDVVAYVLGASLGWWL